MQPDSWPLVYQADYPEGDLRPARSNVEVNQLHRNRFEDIANVTQSPVYLEILDKLDISPEIAESVELTRDYPAEDRLIITCLDGSKYILRQYWTNEAVPEWKLIQTYSVHTGYRQKSYY
jgi:hypothetical protein